MSVADGGVDWTDLLTFCGGVRPAFLGKYLVGSAWRWVHGEATSLVDPVVPGARLRLAPIAAADPIRQAQGEELGLKWGAQDGAALADAIQRALNVGDLALPPNSSGTHVYLEIAEGTALTPEYWSGWSTAVAQAILIGDPAGGGLVPLIQGLLPCIATRFVASATPDRWEAAQAVRAALDTQLADWPVSNARCYAFWASTTDPAVIAPVPAPAWPVFEPYDQKLRAGPVRVPVQLWRYATGDQNVPNHMVGRVTLDLTAAPAGRPDPELDRMLIVRPWTAGNRPTQIGVDRGASVESQVNCLVGHNLTVKHLPEAAAQRDPNDPAGGPVIGPPLNPVLDAPVSFVVRYFSAGPTANGQPPAFKRKDLSRSEAVKLSAKAEIVTVFETRKKPYEEIPAYLRDPANGKADGYAAAWFGAKVVKQPPHTPIYFGVDCDVTAAGVGARGGPAISKAALQAYFEQVAIGMAQCQTDLADQRVPYAVGVYACARACETLYRRGLVSHFWQTFPFFWGDEVPDERSNTPPYRHANLWQVGMEYVNATMVSSHLDRCRDLFPWQFGHTINAGPPSIEFQFGAAAPIVVPYPMTAADLATALHASVTERTDPRLAPSPDVKIFTILFPANPGVLVIRSGGAGPVPPDFNMELRESKGVHDLNVAWGDPGGWRFREGA